MSNRAIGIDPESAGATCVLVDGTLPRVVVREYAITGDALEKFVRWVTQQRDTLVAIEGRNGQSKPFECALLSAGVPFYSFTAYEVAKFRSAVLGQNKNNERDAEAVARYALALETQNRLELSRRVWFVDEELQTVTRLYSHKRCEMTRETNRLWKALRKASGDIYLAFRGSHPQFPFNQNLLKLKGVMRLLAARPDVSSWHLIPMEELIRIAGGPRPGREHLLDALQRLSAEVHPFSSTTTLLIQSSAAVMLVLQTTLESLEKQLQKLSTNNESIQWLCGQRGIAVLTAATMMAEIVDIRRFPTNNHLASYAGLARHEYKTGRSVTEVATTVHNHRLKNAFFSAARNITLHNPDSHLTGYYRSLIKRGMSITEAYKRVGRALVRKIYRELKVITPTELSAQHADPPMATEGVMATGCSNREANLAPSDTTPSVNQYIGTPSANNRSPTAAQRALQVERSQEEFS